MRFRIIGWISVCLLAAGMAGCASIEQKKEALKAKGIEFEGMKAVKVYRF